MPLSDENVRDPRMKRTRQLLQDSLRGLLRRKPLDEILVQEITDAATVNRATFYDHYGDKFDLFNSLIAADFQRLLAQRNVCFDETCSAALSAIVLAVGEFLQQLHHDQTACSGGAASGPLIDAAITLAIRRIVLDGLEKQGRPSPLPRRVVASLVSGAIYGAVNELLSKAKWKAQEAALLSLVPPILRLLEPNAALAVDGVSRSGKRSKRSTGSAR
jgi:AcrR family transcriptional regulator